MAQLGMTKGLSFANDYDKDISRMYQREDFAAQTRAENERKTNYYANLLKKGHASNPRAEKELTALYENLNNQVADIATENPDLEHNVTAMSKFLDVTDQYINNDVLRKDIQVAGEFEKLRNSVGDLTKDEYMAEMDRYNEYINSEPGDPVEPYVYTDYKVYNVAEIAEETIGLLGMEEVTSKDPNPLTGYYENITTVPEAKLIFGADAAYAQDKKRMAIDKTFSQYSENNKELANKYSGPDAAKNWFRDYVRNGIQIQKTQGEMDWRWRQALASQNDAKVTTEYALSQTVKGLAAMANTKTKNEKGEEVFVETEAKAEVYDVNLTVMGEAPVIELNSRNGVLNNKTKETIDFGSNGIVFKKLGTGKWVSVGGVPYMQIVGEVRNAIGSDSYEDTNTKLAEKGFTQEEYYEGIELPGDAKKTAGVKFTGTILVPMNITPEGLSSWSRHHGGQKEVDFVNPQYKDLSRMMSSDPELFRIKVFSELGVSLNQKATIDDYNDLKESEHGKQIGNEYEPDRYTNGIKNGIEGMFDGKTGIWYPLK